jgi:DSHCT (NUC185) domain
MGSRTVVLLESYTLLNGHVQPWWSHGQPNCCTVGVIYTPECSCAAVVESWAAVLSYFGVMYCRERSCAGVVESWAAGNSWDQVVKDCTLDDGDVARLLSRTADLLKQARHCPALLPSLRDTARRAVKAMTRKPIRDLLV